MLLLLLPIESSNPQTQFQDIYIYIIYAPNLRSSITAFDREREHGRFEGSTERAPREQERARGSNTGARESTQGHAYLGAFYHTGRSKLEPDLAALGPALVAYFTPEPTIGHLVSRLSKCSVEAQ